MTAAFSAPIMLTGCANSSLQADGTPQVYVTNIQKADPNTEGENNFIITYSNGKQAVISLGGDTTSNVGIDDLFRKYQEEHPNATYEDFFSAYLTIDSKDNRQVINDCLN